VRWRGVVCALVLAGPASAEEPFALPHTIANVWYRTDTQRGAFGPKHEGDLRITSEALEFSARKIELVIPLASLQIISFGPLGADFDTDWVVIGTERDGVRGLLGLRDGSRLGYGGRTPRIFATLMRVVRERGVAQFAAPDGLEPYTQLDRQIALATPRGWGAFQHGIAGLSETGVTGTILFSPEFASDRSGAAAADPDTERAEPVCRIRTGESPGWILDIRKAKRGMRCTGFTDKGLAELKRWIAADELLGRDLTGPTGGALTPVSIDRCSGVSGVWRGSVDGAIDVVVELRATSDDDFVYLLALRTSAEHAVELGPTFSSGLGTVRFAVARPPRPNPL